MHAAVKTKVRLTIATFVFFNLFASALVHAAVSASGPLTVQLESAGSPFRISELPQAADYSKFEKQIKAKLSKGAELLQVIRDFDYEVARFVSEPMATRQRAILGLPHLPNDARVQAIKSIDWANQIFRYIEGTEESRESRVSGKVATELDPYVEINTDLRDGTSDTNKTIASVGKLRSSLSHLPRFEGISFRGARLSKAKLEKYYKVGQLANDPAFISTSASAEVAMRFAELQYNLVPAEALKVNTLFILKGRTGRPVSIFIDEHFDEDEVLFANGTLFKVTGKSNIFHDDDLNGNTQIILLEEQ